ncbi:BlaI/MecI/CopY family transcriptional regulator [Pedobacter hartonius]|uniref:Predicted transcriptional regulator n=1 Tax=Pedobacter hartonius TaxID=425514 RepID=A0A1H4GV85_9SPHI|nr:BlaI/MecI/CopY family transcriptional regulator [Pedobacter hartonius]SEB13464.1 Predicted transcriptional regulator [Pedobacter hartonius]
MSSEVTAKPTESELEILQILWEKGNCTVRDVHDILTRNKEAGYTTTLKLMQIMHEKGLVKRDTSSKTHIYSALASQQKTQQHLVSRLIDNAFNGSAARMVMQALGNHKSSKDEIEAIKKYLNDLDHN